MRLAPLVMALVLGALGVSLARSLLSRQGVGVVEWVVGVAAIAALGAGAAHFARRSAVQRL